MVPCRWKGQAAIRLLQRPNQSLSPFVVVARMPKRMEATGLPQNGGSRSPPDLGSSKPNRLAGYLQGDRERWIIRTRCGD